MQQNTIDNVKLEQQLNSNSKDDELPSSPNNGNTLVGRGYFGLPFDFKVLAKNGDVFYINDSKSSLLMFSKLDLKQFKVQQFTGIIDRNKTKIYFGDKLRFADKVEWYRGEYWSKVALGIMSKKQALEEIKSKPYEERLVDNNQDFEWLLSGEIQTYWEAVI